MVIVFFYSVAKLPNGGVAGKKVILWFFNNSTYFSGMNFGWVFSLIPLAMLLIKTVQKPKIWKKGSMAVISSRCSSAIFKYYNLNRIIYYYKQLSSLQGGPSKT